MCGEVVETYVDQSSSVGDKTQKHPAYLRMVQDYEVGLLDAIVVYDLDRLTRHPRELEDWIDRAESRGLSFGRPPRSPPSSEVCYVFFNSCCRPSPCLDRLPSLLQRGLTCWRLVRRRGCG